MDLLEQLDNLYGNMPVFYLKFVKEHTFAKELQEGILFANTPKYFREKEKKSQKRGQGDAVELMSVFDVNTAKFTSTDGSGFNFILNNAKVTFHFESDNTVPMICFMGIRIIDMVLLSDDGFHAKLKLPFSEEQYKQMEDNFGEYCVVIGGRELFGKLDTYSMSKNIAYAFDKITYCPQKNNRKNGELL